MLNVGMVRSAHWRHKVKEDVFRGMSLAGFAWNVTLLFPPNTLLLSQTEMIRTIRSHTDLGLE
jgi:hypothetical protein